MRSETFRVKKPAWVRIVNPDPITVYETTWSYGSVVMLQPGGVLRVLASVGPRVLAAYQAPYAPGDAFDCPSDALLLQTPDDLRLACHGGQSLEDRAPAEVKLPYHRLDSDTLAFDRADTARVKPGDVARISRPTCAEYMVGLRGRSVTCGAGPYRQHLAARVPKWSWSIERATLERDGSLVALSVFSWYVEAAYRAPDGRPPDRVLPFDARFRLREEEFIDLADRYRLILEEEELERAVVISVLRSL